MPTVAAATPTVTAAAAAGGTAAAAPAVEVGGGGGFAVGENTVSAAWRPWSLRSAAFEEGSMCSAGAGA